MIINTVQNFLVSLLPVYSVYSSTPKNAEFKRGHENLKKSCNSKMSLETHGKLKEFKKDMEFR